MTNQAFDPREFYRLGRALGNRGTSEAEIRTAIGRVYYAVFIVARDRMRVRGRGNVHDAVVNRVKRRHGYKSIGDQLASLRRLRNVADYQMLPDDTQNRNWPANWQRAQMIANKILPRLEVL